MQEGGSGTVGAVSVGGFATLPKEEQEKLLSADKGLAVTPHIRRMYAAAENNAGAGAESGGA